MLGYEKTKQEILLFTMPVREQRRPPTSPPSLYMITDYSSSEPH